MHSSCQEQSGSRHRSSKSSTPINMFIFYNLHDFLLELSRSALGAQEPDFGANGTRLPENEWKSISIRTLRLLVWIWDVLEGKNSARPSL
jgi:hypothetical protein